MLKDLTTEQAVDRFFAILSAAVAAHPPPAGLVGRIVIGARQQQSYVWWRGTFLEKPFASLVEGPTEQDDAILYIGGRDVAALLLSGAVPDEPELLMVEGNRALLHRFIDAYLRPHTGLSLRAEKNRRK